MLALEASGASRGSHGISAASAGPPASAVQTHLALRLLPSDAGCGFEARAKRGPACTLGCDVGRRLRDGREARGRVPSHCKWTTGGSGDLTGKDSADVAH